MRPARGVVQTGAGVISRDGSTRTLICAGVGGRCAQVLDAKRSPVSFKAYCRDSDERNIPIFLLNTYMPTVEVEQQAVKYWILHHPVHTCSPLWHVMAHAG